MPLQRAPRNVEELLQRRVRDLGELPTICSGSRVERMEAQETKSKCSRTRKMRGLDGQRIDISQLPRSDADFDTAAAPRDLKLMQQLGASFNILLLPPLRLSFISIHPLRPSPPPSSSPNAVHSHIVPPSSRNRLSRMVCALLCLCVERARSHHPPWLPILQGMSAPHCSRRPSTQG